MKNLNKLFILCALFFSTLNALEPKLQLDGLGRELASVIEQIKLKKKLEQIKHKKDLSSLDGLVGKLPSKLAWIMEQLKLKKNLPKKVLLLHGKPGNGKTTLARKFAEYIDGEFMSIAGPSIVGSYVGQGAQNIVDAFARAIDKINGTGKTVVIFIDEIDAIASNVKTEFRAEHMVALQRLWLAIDEHKNNEKMVVIFATNHLNKLDKTFLDRFGSNVFEIKNPDETMRRQVIEYYFGKHNIILEEPTLSKLVKQTEGLSVRAIEDLINEVYVVAQLDNKGIITNDMLFNAVQQTKGKFENNSADEEERDKKIQKISTIVSIVSGILSATVNIIYLGSIFGGSISTASTSWHAH